MRKALERRSLKIIKSWNQWAKVKRKFLFQSNLKFQAKIKQRNIIFNKCRAIQNICGKHLKDPQYSSEGEDNAEVDKETVTTYTEPFERNKSLDRFRDVVKRIVNKRRCEKVIEAVIKMKEENEFYEKNCFQFAENDEHYLYRKFLDHWQNRFDIWRCNKTRSISLYHQSPRTNNDDDDKSRMSSSFSESPYSISPTITITDSQECYFLVQ